MTLVIRQTGIADYLEDGGGRIKVLIMGAPGSGKTRSSSAWPKPLLADCEDGRMSVADRRIPYAAIKSPADMKALLGMAEDEARRPKDQRRFETLVVDTLDAYQRIVIQDYLKRNNKASMSGWQDWGHLDAEMNELVGRLNGLPMNVVVNLHVKDTKVGENDEGEGGYLVKSPKLKGDLRDQIAAEFDLVGYMETGWEAVDGQRALTRYIQWEPSPDKPILKDRSGQLPARTPVTFTDQDYLGLLGPLQEAAKALVEGDVVQTLETEAPVEPVLVTKGGPVGTGAKAAPVKKTAAPKKAAAAPPTNGAVAPVPAVASVPVAPVPVAPVPLVEPVAVPVTEQEAVATVEQVLEGEAVEPETQTEGLQTDVSISEPIDVSPGAPIDVSPGAVMEVEDPGSSSSVIVCGSPRYEGGTVSVTGCGVEMKLEIVEDRIINCISPENQMPDLIQIAGLKTRAFLCNACFANHRNAAKK